MMNRDWLEKQVGGRGRGGAGTCGLWLAHAGLHRKGVQGLQRQWHGMFGCSAASGMHE